MPLLPSTLMGRWRRRTSPSSWRRWAFGTRLKEQGIRTRADQSDPILRSDPNLMVFGNLLTTSFFKPTNKNVIFPFEVVGCHRNFLLSKLFFLNRGFCDIKTPVWEPFFNFWSGYPFYFIAIFTIKRHYKIVVQNLIQYSLKNLSTTLITTRGEKKRKKVL